MAQEELHNEKDQTETIKKYPIDADPKLIFSFPYLTKEDTISYIKNHGRIMFLIRGPPLTKKTKLSDMLREVYPDADYASAVKNIDQFNPTTTYAGKENITATHKMCMNEVEGYCLNKKRIIIVQNCHIKYFDLKPYLEYAALYNYTVIMSITLYRLNVTPEQLQEEKGYIVGDYVLNRFSQFQHIIPMYTGWFLSPSDSEHLRYLTFEMLESLFQNQEFRQSFKLHNKREIQRSFHPREVLSCLAGFTNDLTKRKSYYLSNSVQAAYGKMFEIVLIGYLVLQSGIVGIVQVNEKMKRLISQDKGFKIGQPSKHANITRHNKTIEFPNKEDLIKSNELVLKNWNEREGMDITECSFIHLAQKDLEVIELDKVKWELNKFKKATANKAGILSQDVFTKLENGAAFYKLTKNQWLVKAPQKIHLKTIFTGFYL